MLGLKRPYPSEIGGQSQGLEEIGELVKWVFSFWNAGSFSVIHFIFLVDHKPQGGPYVANFCAEQLFFFSRWCKDYLLVPFSEVHS